MIMKTFIFIIAFLFSGLAKSDPAMDYLWGLSTGVPKGSFGVVGAASREDLKKRKEEEKKKKEEKKNKTEDKD
jgi:hypothetical protein